MLKRLPGWAQGMGTAATGRLTTRVVKRLLWGARPGDANEVLRLAA